MSNALKNLAARAVDFVKDESTELPPTGSTTGLPAMCSKCGARPRAYGDSTNPWCKECLAEYKREYEERRLARKESRGFALGVQAMRADLARRFGELGFSSLEAWEVRDAILQAPAPQIPTDDQ